jgi:curli production assembly/transport component CsgF
MKILDYKSWVGALLVLLLTAGTVQAEDLVFQPVNPNFGGNPFNGPPLLANATAQNDFKDPNAPSFGGGKQSLEERVDSLVLSTLARSLLGNITDPTTGNLVPGIINTGLSTIEITEVNGELIIKVVDNATGEVITFSAPVAQ